jgi:hypothetical protein
MLWMKEFLFRYKNKIAFNVFAKVHFKIPAHKHLSKFIIPAI